MALKIELSFENTPLIVKSVFGLDNISTKNLYGRIYSPTIDERKDKVSFLIRWYEISEEVFIEDELYFLSKSYSFSFDINNTDDLFKQGYNYLKTLPEFEGAIDC